MKAIKVLHVTAHLGGGVGRVLSSIAQFRKEKGLPLEEKFICLEQPENNQFISVLQKAGIEVIIAPDCQETDKLVASADIIQLEWWHHPLLAEWMSKREQLQSRLVVWSHISGLHYPAIPEEFLSLPHKFLFTTPVSQHIPHLSKKIQSMRNNTVGVVHSSGGFDDFPIVQRDSQKKTLRYGYLGTYNFAKLHPDILEFLQACTTPSFHVNFYGDYLSNKQLVSSVKTQRLDKYIQLNGYTHNPSDVLNDMDVFIYLLNPTHYGSTENALLEAMACGVVPIVLNNKIESSIVQHKRTGLIIDSPKTFADAINYLHNNPEARYKLSRECCHDVRKRFSLEKTERQLREHYIAVMNQDKKDFQFQDVFGKSPSEWFHSCLGRFKWCFTNGSESEIHRRLQHSFLYEQSKSSVNHFYHYFNESKELLHWKTVLDKDTEYANSLN